MAGLSGLAREENGSQHSSQSVDEKYVLSLSRTYSAAVRCAVSPTVTIILNSN